MSCTTYPEYTAPASPYTVPSPGAARATAPTPPTTTATVAATTPSLPRMTITPCYELIT
ncbi:hypothetical protein GCM10018962_40980 [Dactylosporangium matsuzakiense]